ncbi:MAG TPA: hypothetical protein VLG76_06870 [Rhabdochlamydiaceae bacterium]|nr:hypothetical protein [Rhabdochlamydiaceae bacterium]
MKKHKKARLSIDCTTEERRYIKMLAAKEDKTISEYLIGLARPNMPYCNRSHIPNKKTLRSLKETKKGAGLEQYESLAKFWESFGEK